MNQFKLNLALIVCFALFSFHIQAQTNDDANSGKVIKKGIELHDAGKYKEAATEFKKVSRSDTNYVLASIELVNTYIADSSDLLAVELCNKLLEIPSEYTPSIYAYKANALDNLKRSDEAVSVYRQGIQKYPLNHVYYYEMGILKFRQKKYAEAQDWFIQCIRINPYYANAHFQLGNLASMQGNIVQTMLAWQFYLLLNNSSKRAQNLVLALEKMAKNEYDFGDLITIPEFAGQNDFSEVEALVKSKVALSNKYKAETKLNFNLTKQIQLVLEKLTIDKSDKGFMMEFYVPLYNELYKRKFLEPFSYQILGGMEVKEVDEWLKKNETKKQAFFAWVNTYLGEGICTFDAELNGKTVKARHFYSGNYKISSVGNQNAKGENIGYWNYYYNNAVKKSEGGFNDKGQRNGLWKFYSTTGIIDATEIYIDGKVDGTIESYYSNGSIKSRRNFANGLLEGKQEYFYATGGKSAIYEYKNNIENGKRIAYNQNGSLNYEINVVNAKMQGELNQYYPSGHLKQKASFKDNNKIGKATEYFDYPQNAISQEFNYENGKAVGLYKSYHQNGKISETGEYNKEELKIGVWKTFNEEGVLTVEENYDKGKINGTTKYYSNRGKLTEEYVYKNDMLQLYKAYDVDGKIVYQNSKDGKSNYDVMLYYPNGNVKRTGRVTNKFLDGTWKNYSINDYLMSQEEYQNSKKNGLFTSYYENGKTKMEVNYVDGQMDGYCKEYYKNGKIKSEGAYIQGNEAGEWKSYHANGAIASINFYNNGSYDNWQQYFAVNGKLTHEDFVELDYIKKRMDYDSLGTLFQESPLDKGTGVLEIKYPNGKLYWKNTYKDDYRQGEYIALYPDGKTFVTKNYLNGKLNGEAKYYYPSGKIKAEEFYINGKLNGHAINYFENGNKSSDFNYEFGEKTGKGYYYYPNNQIELEYEYKNNLIDGEVHHYDESGELIVVKQYEEDIIVSYQHYNAAGTLVAPIKVKNETCDFKSFYKNGNPSITYTLKKGALEGTRKVYFPNGKLANESFFECDDRTGKRTYYYSSGKVKTVENWLWDELNGPTITYYENGKVKSEGNYLNDEKHGIFNYYDETGKLKNKYTYYNGDLINEQ